MSQQGNFDVDAFRPLGIEEIVDELGSESEDLAGALIELRRSPSHTLWQKVAKISDGRQPERIGVMGEGPASRRGPALWQHLALRLGAIAAMLVVAVALLIATVAPVRAAFERMLQQRFGLVLVETEQIASRTGVSESSREVTVEEAVVRPSITLEDAQARVPFTIPMPSVLPEGFEYWAVYVGTAPYAESMDDDGNRIASDPSVQVVLVFKPNEDHQSQYHPDATLSLLIMDQTDVEGGYAVQAGNEQEVAVNGNRAILVQGAWVRRDEGALPSADSIIWDDTYDATMLSWQADGFTYTLSGSGLELSPEDYIRIAESIR